MERTFRIFFLQTVLSCVVLTVAAQTEMRSLDTGDGLLSNTVRVLFQDRNGLIWIGTGEGLNSFDGYDVIRHDFAQGEMSRYVNCIHPDREGNMWIGTDDAVYCLGDSECVQTDAVVSCITHDRDGILWIGTLGNGLYKCSRSSASAGFNIERFVPDERIETLFVDNKGMLWAFCMDGTVLNYDRMSNTVQRARLTWENGIHERVVSAYQDYSGDIWLGTWDRGLLKLHTNTMRVVPTAYTDVRGLNHIHCMTGVEPYVLLVGSDDGMAKLDLLSDNIELDSRKRFIYTILADAEGGLWMGTYYSGVYYRLLDEGRFATYPLFTDEECIISCFAETPDGSMWAGSDNMGVIRFDGEPGVVTGHFLRNRNVHSLLPYEGKMLVGSYSGGIDLLDYTSGTSVELIRESVYSMSFDRDGTLWFGTLQRIYRMNPADKVPEIMREGVGMVASIREDMGGRLWFATEKGLLSYDPDEESWKEYADDEGVLSKSIFSLHLSSGGLLLVAGDKGMSYMLPGDDGFTPISPDGASRVLYAVSDMGNIWYTTSDGLYKYNIQEDRTDYYGGETGLRDGGFIAGSGWMSTDGRIWLGTYMGVSSFHPSGIRTNMYSPAALITGVAFRARTRPGVVYQDREIDLDGDNLNEIIIPYKYNSVVLTYTALSYRVPDRNRFRVILEGFEGEWTETDLRRSVYTNLPAGKYTFKVISCNSDRIWSNDVTKVQFTILPHRLAGKTAIVIYILLIILSGIYAFHLIQKRIQVLSENKLKSYVREYERTEKERRSIDFEKKLKEIIQENLSNADFSSEMIADRLFVSRSSLFAKVKEITGTTPHQLILDARLEEAARKLSEGNCTVNDVCYMVGFNSPNYFSKCFKQKFGCNPRDWRK